MSRVLAPPGQPVPSVTHVTKKKRKKRGGKNILRESIYGLHAAASSILVISLWVKEGSRLCADWRPRVETVGSYGRGVHMMWVQVVAIIETL